MELTRRDALAALAGVGIVGGGGVAALGRTDGVGEAVAYEDQQTADGEGVSLAETRTTLVAVARIVYPSDITGIETFVETYALGRIEDRESYRQGVFRAVAELNGSAESWYDERYVDLNREKQESLLREVGADTAEPKPTGTTAERVRHYVVNELLYALYTSPTGGTLVGLENPQGYPGGLESYQRGPR